MGDLTLQIIWILLSWWIISPTPSVHPLYLQTGKSFHWWWIFQSLPAIKIMFPPYCWNYPRNWKWSIIHPPWHESTSTATSLGLTSPPPTHPHPSIVVIALIGNWKVIIATSTLSFWIFNFNNKWLSFFQVISFGGRKITKEWFPIFNHQKHKNV